MLTRRHFIQTTGALFSVPIAAPAFAAAPATSDRSMWDTWDARVTPANYDPFTSNPWGFPARYLPQLVEAKDTLKPGDIHVDAIARYLYHIRPGGVAMRYGVAIGRGNLYEPGEYTIRRKTKWPSSAIPMRSKNSKMAWTAARPIRWGRAPCICMSAIATPI